MKRLLVVASIVAMGLMGCSSSDGDTLSEEQANRAYASTSTAITEVNTAAAQASISGDQVSVTVDCSGGGTAAVDGRFGGQSDFSLDVVFDNCVESGITIDGTLDYQATINDNGARVAMSGTLTYSGEVDATCGIDVTLELDSTSGISIEGSICGQDVSDQLSAS
ncbi:MAG: hypothetical protein MJE77_07305 [Proteobacteria bacterium]|nr:hypothetical protein [Pseudomonadota bacterium]